MHGNLSAAPATIGAENAEVLFAGPQNDFVGLDQINLRISHSLIGRGQVEIKLTVDGQLANTLLAAIN